MDGVITKTKSPKREVFKSVRTMVVKKCFSLSLVNSNVCN